MPHIPDCFLFWYPCATFFPRLGQQTHFALHLSHGTSGDFSAVPPVCFGSTRAQNDR